jgi:galactose-1-phosphate uridylyltransferase
MYSVGWERDMPTTLITYDDGTNDLHCQTGDHHNRSIKLAKKKLKERNLKIVDNDSGSTYPSGIYYSVEQIHN